MFSQGLKTFLLVSDFDPAMATNGENSCQNPVNKDYRQFFDTFQSTVDVRDPLPLKVGSHTIREHELEGEIVDWTLQYLQQKYLKISSLIY